MPFSCVLPADYHRLRVGGLILAAVLCLIGIMILLSKMENTHACEHVMLPFLEPAKALLCPAIKKKKLNSSSSSLSGGRCRCKFNQNKR